MAVPPKLIMILGWASSIWRIMNGWDICNSCGVGVLFPGGRQFRILLI